MPAFEAASEVAWAAEVAVFLAAVPVAFADEAAGLADFLAALVVRLADFLAVDAVDLADFLAWVEVVLAFAAVVPAAALACLVDSWLRTRLTKSWPRPASSR